MNIDFEIGDTFIINWKLITHANSIRICKDIEKAFQIKRFSKSGLSVYFDDFRTNKRGCRCAVCSIKQTEKSIGKRDIILKQKYLSLQREIKLKQLLKN
jgi:hypothetical protein